MGNGVDVIADVGSGVGVDVGAGMDCGIDELAQSCGLFSDFYSGSHRVCCRINDRNTVAIKVHSVYCGTGGTHYNPIRLYSYGYGGCDRVCCRVDD